MILYNSDYNAQIREICLHSKAYQTILRSKKYAYLFEYILKCTDEMFKGDEKKPILGRRINFILNEYQEFPKCVTPGCNNRVKGLKTLKWNDIWTEHCCNRCAQLDPKIAQKRNDRKQELYGDPNYNGNLEDIKRKNLERYGSEWFFSSDIGKRKIRDSWISKGYDHPMHSQKIKGEMSRRYMERYGVPYSCLNPEVIKKARLPYFYEGLYFRSSWELAYYIYLEGNGVVFEYQPSVFFEYVDDSGKKRYYFPDFKINGEFVEIKGNQFIGKDGKYHNPYDLEHKTDGIYEAKHKCMVENGVKIMTKEDMNHVFDYCIRKFGNRKWYLGYKVNERPKNSIVDMKDLNIDMDIGNLMREFEYFKTKPVGKNPSKGVGSKNAIVKYFQQDVFFRKEREIWKNDLEIRNRLIENRCKFLKKKIEDLTVNDILMGFKRSGFYYGYSHFNPLWFKWFIERYGIKRCYDPCGGWGHRLLGGMGLEKYIYNDLSPSTRKNVERMVKFFSFKNIVVYGNDCRTFKPVEEYDAIFTCPPYFNLEQYECGIFKNIGEFNALIDSIFSIFNENEKCRIMGLVLREDLLTESHRNYASRFQLTPEKEIYLTNKAHRQREYMYVYCK